MSDATSDKTASEDSAQPAPLLRVVKGEPTEDELAALVAVVAARRAEAASQAARRSRPRRRSAWGDLTRATRPVVRPGPDGWRRSALPG